MPLGFGRRKDDEPPSPFGGNTRGGWERARPAGSRPADPRDDQARAFPTAPGPEARSVARPRIVAVVGWVLMIAIGPGVALTGTTGGAIFGAIWTLGLGALLALLLRTRVVVDGHDLFVRALRGWEPPVDLSHLRSATVDTGSNFAQWILLVDHRGHHARIDGINLRLKGLYRELAIYIGPWEDTADDRLQRRIGRYR
jgi:hypothetical protein